MVTATQGNNSSNVAVKGDDNWVAGQPKTTQQIQVWNNSGVELPNTGGPGTVVLAAIGVVLLVAGAAGMALRERGAGAR